LRVLLVQPPTLSGFGLQGFMLFEPIGLESVAAALLSQHEVRLLDMRLEPGLCQELAIFKPDAVGVPASFTSDVYNTYQVLDIVREHDPRIFTFVGGVHATMMPSDFREKADAVVLGEGEMGTPELLRCWEEGRPLDNVTGLAFRRGAEWIQTPDRPLMRDLNEGPLPAHFLTAKYLPHYFMASRRPCASVETARGCPYRCNFCSVTRFFGHSYRPRSTQRVIEELKQIKCEEVFITDDNALASPAHAESLADEIKKSGIQKRYMIQVRADSAVEHRDLLLKWQEVGLEGVFIGFESITQKGLDDLSKHLKVDYVERSIETLQQMGINVMGSFMVSSESEKEDFAALRSFVKRTRVQIPVFSVLTPFPGTEIYKERAGELTTKNYELYDVLHAILPTRLELGQFYRQFIRLFISAYFSHFTPKGLAKGIGNRKGGAFLRNIWTGLRVARNNNPWALARHHRLPPGRLSERRFPKKARQVRVYKR
jgi:radical SAM superfamily enzyme YgiQ (UPF0313 family)